MMDRDAIERAVVERFMTEIVSKAELLPDFLTTELPLDSNDEAITKHLIDLGHMAARMSPIEETARFDYFMKRFKGKVGKRVAWAVFWKAAREQRAKLAETNNDPASEDRTKITKPKAQIVEESIGFYERIAKDGSRERISTFSLEPVKAILTDIANEPVRVCARVQDPAGNVLAHEWIIPKNAWHSKREFIRSLPNALMQWYGSDEDTQALHEHLTAGKLDRIPHVRGTETLGLHAVNSLNRFVTPGGTLDEHGHTMKDPDLVYASVGGCTLLRRLPSVLPDFQRDEIRIAAQKAIEGLPHVHEPIPTAALYSWFAAAAFKPFLQKQLGGFPILNLATQAGSGKTSLVSKLFWPMFSGVTSGELLSVVQTPFALVKDLASTNAHPIVLDEFNANNMLRYLESFLRYVRRVYTSDVETRGQQDQTVKSFELSAPLAVLGESRLDIDPATAERCYFVSLSKDWLMANAEARETFRNVTKLPLSEVGLLFQAWSVTAPRDELLAAARGDVFALLLSLPDGSVVAPRTEVMLVVGAFGLRALRAFAEHVGARWFAHVEPSQLLRMLLREAADLDPEDEQILSRARNALDDAIVAYSQMASAGRIEEGREFAWVDGKLFLALAPLEGARAEMYAGRHEPNPSPGLRALYRLARSASRAHGSYVMKTHHRLALSDGGRPYGVLIDFAQFPEQAGADEFPAKALRSWGGARRGEDPLATWKRGGSN